MATLPSAHWSNVLDVPTRIAGSRARPNESPQVVACQSVRVLYLIIFPRPAVPASAHRRFSLVFSRLLGLSPFLVRSPSLSLSLSLSHFLSAFLSLSLSIYLSLSFYPALSLLSLSRSRPFYNPRVWRFARGSLHRERAKKAEESRCRAARVLRSYGSYEPPPYILHISACTFGDPGSRILIANDQLLAIYRKGEKERTVSIIDTRLDSILLVLDRIDSICGEKCIWRTRSISNRRVRSINTRNIREYRS